MTNDDLAQALKANLDEVEARIGASSHPHKDILLDLAHVAHRALWRLAKRLSDSGDVSTESVGGDKP